MSKLYATIKKKKGKIYGLQNNHRNWFLLCMKLSRWLAEKYKADTIKMFSDLKCIGILAFTDLGSLCQFSLYKLPVFWLHESAMIVW